MCRSMCKGDNSVGSNALNIGWAKKFKVVFLKIKLSSPHAEDVRYIGGVWGKDTNKKKGDTSYFIEFLLLIYVLLL